MLRFVIRRFCEGGVRNKKFEEMLHKLKIKLPDGGKEQPRQPTAEVDYRNFNSKNNFIQYYKENKTFLNENADKYLLFLDNLSTYVYDTDEGPTEEVDSDVSEIVLSYNDKIGNFEPFYFISFLESLNKLEYYGDNKIWIAIESILTKSNLLKFIDLRYYYIILKAFQRFFSIKDTTVSAEDIFELVEYNTILKLKELKDLKLTTKDDLHILDLYILFAKNLEGSTELYNVFIQKIILPNLKIIEKYNPNYLVNIYTASIFIKESVILKNNNFELFLKELDLILQKNKAILNNNINKDFISWCFDKRKIKF
jgi:hypothetical protein